SRRRARLAVSAYSREFFDAIREGSRASAEVVVPLVLELTLARSVVDVGCGDGTWLAAFRRHGAREILGIDGATLRPDDLAIPPEDFVVKDLAAPFTVDRTFDLAVSLEVGEHLPDSAAPGLVASIARLAPIVVFSAAVPHQTGHRHVNERWP